MSILFSAFFFNLYAKAKAMTTASITINNVCCIIIIFYCIEFYSLYFLVVVQLLFKTPIGWHHIWIKPFGTRFNPFLSVYLYGFRSIVITAKLGPTTRTNLVGWSVIVLSPRKICQFVAANSAFFIIYKSSLFCT